MFLIDVEEDELHCAVMIWGVMFCLVVSVFVGSGLPVDEEFSFFCAFLDSIETYVDRLIIFCLVVLFANPARELLSTCMDVAVWGWPS